MNRDDVIRWAREAGFDVNFDIRTVSVEGVFINKELERFANLVAAHETCEFAALKKEVKELREENMLMREVMMASYAPRPWVRE
jgi:hypothetical protein